MKRLIMMATLLMLLSLTARGISAQDASPATGGAPSSALIDALGYPTLAISYDGSTVTIPDTLAAGRYLLDFTATGATPVFATFLGANADHSLDEILTALQSPSADQGPPPVYFEIPVVGLPSTANPTVITLTPGDWVLAIIGDSGATTAELSVTGDMPSYDAISDAVNVDLHEMVIDMPDSVPAGDHIWQIQNTGALPHMLSVSRVSGPITDEQIMNAFALDMGAPDATPVAEGAVGSPSDFQEVIGGGAFSNGETQLVEANLEPGTYVAICFVMGPGDVGLHAMEGMYKVFTVE